MAHELNVTPVSSGITGDEYIFGASGTTDPSPQPYLMSAIAAYVIDLFQGGPIQLNFSYERNSMYLGARII